MARIGKSPTLFFVTSPRSPLKIIPELQVFSETVCGKEWNNETQREFTEALVQKPFYVGTKTPKDPAFTARDRITRLPKAYGFVSITPECKLTEPGRLFIESRRKDEVLLRQLLKFQLPSVNHAQLSDSRTQYWIKPFLEILRLIDSLGYLAFDELYLFGMQLTSFHKFDEICTKISDFRIEKDKHKGRYRKFFAEVADKEFAQLYQFEENSETVKKKIRNLRDYTDACFRYLRATQCVTISRSGHSLKIAPEKQHAVTFILETVDRNPQAVNDRSAYEEYLFDASQPELFNDDLSNLKKSIRKFDAHVDLDGLSINALKDLEYSYLEESKIEKLAKETLQLKSFENLPEIVEVYSKIGNKEFYDDPLMLEWNTWRAMTMLNVGEITANLNFDDSAQPLSTAPGNCPDIVCDYGEFCLNVEVTLQGGQKQYDNEGEPVARHIGRQIEASGKPTYCIFIAKNVSAATIAHFYTLYQVNVRLYGGTAMVYPMSIKTFVSMLQSASSSGNQVKAEDLRRLFDFAREAQENSEDEIAWFSLLEKRAANWFTPV